MGDFNYDSFRQGQQWGDTGSAVAAAAARRDTSEALGEWQAYARRLESQLEQANLNLVRACAGQEANNEVLRELRQHVFDMDPRDPMGHRDHITPMLRAKIREKVERQGYRVVNLETLDIAAR
jgi:hypothetical protein